MDFDDIISNSGFYMLMGVGYVAFVFMLMILKGMGNQDIMPLWVKIATLVLIPVISAVFAGIMSE
jgi:hypothetical protein